MQLPTTYAHQDMIEAFNYKTALSCNNYDHIDLKIKHLDNMIKEMDMSFDELADILNHFVIYSCTDNKHSISEKIEHVDFTKDNNTLNQYLDQSTHTGAKVFTVPSIMNLDETDCTVSVTLLMDPPKGFHLKIGYYDMDLDLFVSPYGTLKDEFTLRKEDKDKIQFILYLIFPVPQSKAYSTPQEDVSMVHSYISSQMNLYEYIEQQNKDIEKE